MSGEQKMDAIVKNLADVHALTQDKRPSQREAEEAVRVLLRW
jgi:hypothetical protein